MPTLNKVERFFFALIVILLGGVLALIAVSYTCPAPTEYERIVKYHDKLTDAVSHEDIDKLDKLLDNPEFDINKEVCDKDRMHAFLWAAWQGSVEGLRCFVEHGVDVNLVDHCSYALREAAAAENVEAVRFLLEHGCKTYIEGVGSTPLAEAARAGSVAIVSILLEHGANPNEADRSFPPLYYALHSKAKKSPQFNPGLECAKLLIEAGADVNDVDMEPCMPVDSQ